MLTEFGKICRKIRIDSNELLADMAERLDVSSSFLSAVENGKKSIPEGWASIISKLYALGDKAEDELESAALESAKQVKIRTEKLNREDKDLVFAFARNFEKLEQSDRDEILKLLRK